MSCLKHGKGMELIMWSLKYLQVTSGWAPQNSEVPEIALHSYRLWPGLFNAQGHFLSALPHTIQSGKS